jgi:hypothetical protein
MTPLPDLEAVVINERDRAFAELEAAGVIAPAGSDDANGNVIYRMGSFPSGEEGRRLRALFDQHVQGRAGQRRK